MRLVNVTTLGFQEFRDAEIPPYAIASHRWGEDEVTYRGFDRLHKYASVGYPSEGFQKLMGFCMFVKRHRPDIRWLWIDSCCIDRANFTELNQAINSMFKWYRRSELCIAYLQDVQRGSEMANSVWFTRGWTLQELLAPKTVVILTYKWEVIGAKKHSPISILGSNNDIEDRANGRREHVRFLEGLTTINDRLSDITGIPENVLYDFRASKTESVEKRLEWMGRRETTEPEDLIYSQMGMFGVYMPLIYGEGLLNALQRLQQEITMRTSAGISGPFAANSSSTRFTRTSRDLSAINSSKPTSIIPATRCSTCFTNPRGSSAIAINSRNPTSSISAAFWAVFSRLYERTSVASSFQPFYTRNSAAV